MNSISVILFIVLSVMTPLSFAGLIMGNGNPIIPTVGVITGCFGLSVNFLIIIKELEEKMIKGVVNG